MKKEMKAELIKFESEIIEAWHTSMGNRQISFKMSLTQVGLCAERICQALHIRKFGSKSNLTFHKLIMLFKRKGIFDIQIENHMNDLRKPSASRRHDTTWFDKPFIDICRLKLFEIVKWYQDFNKITLAGLKINTYSKILQASIAATFFKLHADKKISENSFKKSLKNKNIGNYKIQNTEKILRTPVFASLAIDASYSMIQESEAVIENQQIALNAIRGSMICQKGALYLMQHTFNHESRILNSLSKIDTNGEDNIVKLDKSNYSPQSTTALYDTVFEAISLLIHEANSLKESNGRVPKISIAVMTDGDDTYSQNHTAQDIKLLLSQLKEKNMLKSSVVIGWTSSSLNTALLEKLTEEIGFNDYVCFDKSDPSAIRKAFNFWSKSM